MSPPRRIFRTTNAVAGVAVSGDAASVRALAVRSDVVSISPLVPKKVENAHAARLTNVLKAWQDLGVFGNGVRVGVIDTGIDYTHANFGGPGTPAAFDGVNPPAPRPCSRAPRSSAAPTSRARTTTRTRTFRRSRPRALTATRSTATATAPTWPGRPPVSA